MRSTKVRRYTRIVAGLLLLVATRGWAQYPLHILPVDKDSLFIQKQLGLTGFFRSKDVCMEYIYALPSLLQGKGYLTASLDSVGSDSAGTTIRLYIGNAYRWARIDVSGVDP